MKTETKTKNPEPDGKATDYNTYKSERENPIPWARRSKTAFRKGGSMSRLQSRIPTALALGVCQDALDVQELEKRIITCVNNRDTQNVCR